MSEPLIVAREYRGSLDECKSITDFLRSFGHHRGVMSWSMDPDPDGDGWTIRAMVVA